MNFLFSRSCTLEPRLLELAAADSQQHLEDLDLEVEFMDALDWLEKTRKKHELRELAKVSSMADLSDADRERLRNLGGRPKSE